MASLYGFCILQDKNITSIQQQKYNTTYKRLWSIKQDRLTRLQQIVEDHENIIYIIKKIFNLSQSSTKGNDQCEQKTDKFQFKNWLKNFETKLKTMNQIILNKCESIWLTFDINPQQNVTKEELKKCYTIEVWEENILTRKKQQNTMFDCVDTALNFYNEQLLHNTSTWPLDYTMNAFRIVSLDIKLKETFAHLDIKLKETYLKELEHLEEYLATSKARLQYRTVQIQSLLYCVYNTNKSKPDLDNETKYIINFHVKELLQKNILLTSLQNIHAADTIVVKMFIKKSVRNIPAIILHLILCYYTKWIYIDVQ